MKAQKKLICVLCDHAIEPAELRFKVWNTDEKGNVVTRRYVHLVHPIFNFGSSDA